MRTAYGVRRGIMSSPVPMSDWARAIGITKQSLHGLMHGAQGMGNGPAMKRLILLFDALENDRAKWIKRPSPSKVGRPHWVLDSREYFGPTQSTLRVDFRSSRLVPTHEVSASPL